VNLLKLGLSMTLLALTTTISTGADDAVSLSLPRPLDFSPFEQALAALTPERQTELDVLVFEATVARIQDALAQGRLTSVELTTYYLTRIRQYDADGLRSFIELNPDALTIAAQLDAERASGSLRGVLHGIPVGLKDNVATGDRMHNTAGAAALADNFADRDAFITQQLRSAGAVILGKLNMSEWAFWMSAKGVSGYSTLGGQVVSPFNPAFDPSGSSSGSAVAVSANLVAVTIGTETSGSIISPAANNSAVGIHPSLGLVSRDRIIPITDQTDTAGPITRTVSDAALLLRVIAGVDTNDPATQDAGALAGTDFTQFLDAQALEGKRVGFYTGATELPENTSLDQFYAALGWSEAAAALEKTGAEVVPIFAQNPEGLLDSFLVLGGNGIRMGVEAYLHATQPNGTVQRLADVVAFNQRNPALYARYGQEKLESAITTTMREAEYRILGEQARQQARDYLETLFMADNVDAIVSINNSMSLLYSLAGYPAVTVPAGLNVDGKPYGVTFTGHYLDDGVMIGYAYAFEQANPLRQIPPVGRVGG
jgi:amidase